MLFSENINLPQNVIDCIVVPQGAEYQAVCRGMKPQNHARTKIMAIPPGIEPFSRYLTQWGKTPEFLEKPPRGIILMGLGGSLAPRYRVGHRVLYLECGSMVEESDRRWKNCDQQLNRIITEQLGGTIEGVRGITSDRIICLAQQKQDLGKRYQADVVDMEGIVLLDFCERWKIPVTMIRVISDNFQQDLPNLTPAFNADGQLNFFRLAYQMLQYPIRSMDLIRSSLMALKQLENIAQDISPLID
ncbi:conserved hypothetical protein [Rippkaea orientalis PCC 8801]|uniref:Nucleoside phosphorylase domain-containing protein n=1 Tax=Rippkaea orientalis (strain PCC 8801 / RF-1) TaxID=41431 RepID=B7JWV4_RIPO1|nr:hypothetical protein [Rippkaea orientalis]ACK65803.1 conserved hypothetical protein [Rippkaea orientalis PCC 8801]